MFLEILGVDSRLMDEKTNCYILGEKNHESLIVDPGGQYKDIIEIIEKFNAPPKVILLTHAHADHWMAVKNLYKQYKDQDLKLWIHEDDFNLLTYDNIDLYFQVQERLGEFKSKEDKRRMLLLQVVRKETRSIMDILTGNLKKKFLENGDVVQFNNLKLNILLTKGHYVAKEFVQLIHDYRAHKVNPKHLNLEQLYHPQKVYIYLRNRHWKDGIDIEFCKQWIQMKFTDHALTDQDISDFETIFHKFGIPTSILVSELSSSPSSPNSKLSANIDIKETKRDSVPSVKNFREYKQFILKRLEDINEMLKNRTI